MDSQTTETPPETATETGATEPPSEPPSETALEGDETEPSLWQHSDFVKLWAAQSTSLIGSQVTIVAMPLVAAVLLDASNSEMGVLGAFARLPMVLFPFVGVWVDRVRRRQVMLWSDFVRAGVMATVPLLYLADMLSLVWLYFVMLVLGFFSVLFEIAYRSYLPTLVETKQLGEGNSKLQLSDSVSKAAGPGLAGILLGWWSAAVVIVADVASYVVSAFAILFIRKPEPKPQAPDGDDGKVLAAIWAGLQWVMAQPLIRPLALASAVYSFFEIGVLQTLYVKFLIDEPEIPKAGVGFIMAIGGPGAIVGALLSVRLMKSIGPGPSMLWCTVIGNGTLLLVPAAVRPLWLAVTMLVTSQFVVNLTTQIFLVQHLTLLQTITPSAMQGRVVATIWSLGLVPAPIGALLGGVLGDAIGLRPTVFIAAFVGALVPVLLLFFSPIPKLRSMPDGPIDDGPVEEAPVPA